MIAAPGLDRSDKEALLALVNLTQVGPARLAWLCSGRSPSLAFEQLVSGELRAAKRKAGISEKMVLQWMDEARWLNPSELFEEHERAGIGLLFPGDEGWPFAHDPEPPSVVFYLGTLAALEASKRVCVVGTRRCSNIGRSVARSLGRELAEAGVGVVSGLALGIDGEAHTGALEGAGAAPLGVVGSGLDCVYPPRNRVLWERISTEGLLMSEAPLGAGPLRWRFPARNRLLAGISDLVVVVESHSAGGSLLTVESALERDVEVASVPGSVRAPCCDGTNQLLIEGAVPVRNASDVLALLGLSTRPREGRTTPLRPMDGDQSRIYEQVLAGVGHIDRIAASSGLALSETMAVVQSLVTMGAVRMDGSSVLIVDSP